MAQPPSQTSEVLTERSAAGGEVADASEEFVRVLLLEVRQDGSVTAHNYGRPWPYRLSAHDRRPVGEAVAEAEPLPPLGLFPLLATLPEPQHVGRGR